MVEGTEENWVGSWKRELGGAIWTWREERLLRNVFPFLFYVFLYVELVNGFFFCFWVLGFY